MRKLPRFAVSLLAATPVFAPWLAATPAPGDVFREYVWTPQTTDAGGALRVGGRHGETDPDRGWAHGFVNAPVTVPHALDLEAATRCEVVIEKLLCHDGTRGLALSVNGNDWIPVPEAEKIPAPQWEYQHHFYPVVAVPLGQLRPGEGNQFRLKVDPEHPWQWPQNLIYGVHFRIYYDPAKKPHPTGRVSSPTPASGLGLTVELRAEVAAAASGAGHAVRRVDFIGLYEDVNLEGDGAYRRWHYRYSRGELAGCLGTATSEPFEATWDTSWVPEQDQQIELAARIADETGLTYMTEAIGGLTLARAGGASVELCKPYDVPRRWVTRTGAMEEKFKVAGDLGTAVAAQLVWSSWSPGYMEGIAINGRKVFDREGPRYACYIHRVPMADLSAFLRGENRLATGMTPKHDGQTVHGMEVNWPGIMVLIRYERRTDERRPGPNLRLSIEGPDRPGRCEKIEFSIETDLRGENPFDPREGDLTVTIVDPSGSTFAVPAFWYQHFDRARHASGGKERDWFYPVGQPGWRARFSPRAVGAHTCRASLGDATGTFTSNEVTFECAASARRGFVRVSTGDPRFLELSDGTPFFPIGQNLAFVSPTHYLDTHAIENVFKQMAENGANFARIWACCEDWALAIEARKSAWARSWGWEPRLVVAPGPEGYHAGRLSLELSGEAGASAAVSPAYQLAVRPETAYEFSGWLKTDGRATLAVHVRDATAGEPIAGSREKWTQFKRRFTTGAGQWWLDGMALRLREGGRLWVRGISLREGGDGPELLPGADPDLRPRGSYNLIDASMLDAIVAAAERHGVFLQLTMLTRDHYMGTLGDFRAGPLANERGAAYEDAIDDAKRLMRYAVARWGHSTSVAAWEYFNEMNPGLPLGRFYREVGRYVHEIDICRRVRTTSAWGPAPRDWANPAIDMAQPHYYVRPSSGALWKDEVASLLEQVRAVRKVVPDKPALMGEFGLATDRWGLSPYMAKDQELVHFHNVLWSSALSGSSGTALFWWWETLDEMRAYPHYRPLAAFLADVPFTTAKLRPFTVEDAGTKARIIGLRGADCAFVWVFNPQATWWNVVVEKNPPGELRDASFSVEGLAAGRYRVEWWDTREGKVIGEAALEANGAPVRLVAPPFARDIACKVRR